MPAATPEPILPDAERCQLAEGPLWHTDQQRLYFTDISAGALHRYDPRTGLDEVVYRGEQVGAFTIQEDGALLLFQDHGGIRQWQPDRTVRTLRQDIAAERDTRFNDVAADPEGRVFCSVLGKRDANGAPIRQGRTYRLDQDGTLTVVIEDVMTPNGIDFTPDRRGMYFSDTRRWEIALFDFDPSSGAISNRRTFISTAGGDPRPDGLTVDADGCVWACLYGGGCAVRYTPDGREDRRITLPATNTTALCFGGNGMEELFITSAANGGEAAGGQVFRVRPGVKGVPELRSRIVVP